MTERFICTMGTPGTARSFCRSSCDCVAITYRCLFVSPTPPERHLAPPAPAQERGERRTDDARDALVARDRLAVVTLPPLELLREVHRGLRGLALEVQLVDAALRDH